MVHNPKNNKEYNKFISSVLKLENNYKNFIFLNPNSHFLFEEDIFFKKIKNNDLDYNLDKIDCLLYLVPDIFQYFNYNSSVVNYFPNIDSICKYQKNYNIYNLNVTLIKHEQGIINFIMNNGLNYICLLYEYIYQLSENYNLEEFQDNTNCEQDLNIIMKIIYSIFKKTLFILDKSYNDINVLNMNKPLKQIYINLFYSLESISKKTYIIDEILINYFFCIIKHYYNYISTFTKKKSYNIFDIISKRKDNNNDIFNKYLFNINGWIDFLLNPEIYNFKNMNIIIKLFNELASYLNYIHLNKESENTNLFLKLLKFIPKINNYYENNDLESDKNNDNIDNLKINENNINNNGDNTLNSFFRLIKIFMESNPSKSKNIVNLNNILKCVNKDLSGNNQIFYIFNNFINELINDNLELFFSDDEKDNEPINLLIKYALKIAKNKEMKNEKEIINKKFLFNKLFSILIKIIFNKQKIGKNKQIMTEFNLFIKQLEKTNDLISIFSKEIINILNHLFEIRNNQNNKEIEYNYLQEITKIYISEDLKHLSNYFYEIFDLILYFLESPNENNDKKVMDMIIIENLIIDELLTQIENIIRKIIENNNKIYNNNNIIKEKDNNNDIYIIYCLINFLKFYYNILFKKIYSEKYIQNFADICELCCKCGLIYSNILIETDEKSEITKTPLEIILDICVFYITLTSNKFNENVFDNNINKDTIIEEQRIIYEILKTILYPNNNENNLKELKKKYTIFYINDYFRLLSSNYPINGKKRPKNDPIYSEFTNEFNIYQNNENLLINEKKYNLNFSTFFILKCSGYKKLLFELFVNIFSANSQAKEFLKFDDILTLIIQVIQQNYNEHELLFLKNKSFFFTSKSANTSYYYYSEVKKKIENNIKKNDYSEFDNYILNTIFNKGFNTIYTSIYSGCCISKKHEHKLSDTDKNSKKTIKQFFHVLSSKNLCKEKQDIDIDIDKDMNRTLSDHDNKNNNKYNYKNSFKTTISDSSQSGYSPSEKDNSITQDEYELELQVEEASSFDKLDDNLSNPQINSIFYTPLINEHKLNSQRQKILDFSPFNDHLKLEKKASFYSEISNESNNEKKMAYINYLYEPDECNIINVKKELMMNVFSIYFFDSFFINENFKLLKNYYLQNFEGIQKSTKLLEYPSKIKNFTNGLEPFLFLKPFSLFFNNKTFPITHKYYYQYIKDKNICPNEPIILYKKNMPQFCFDDKFDKRCELIKINRCYFGHIIGSKKINYIIFQQEKYDFYDDFSEPNKDKSINKNQSNMKDLNELFTLSNVLKKPFNTQRKLSFISNLNYVETKALEHIKKYKKKKTIIILFDEIEEILERRFLLEWQAIEIYLKNGKSYYFNFLSKEQNEFILDIFKNNKKTKNKIHLKDNFKIHIKNLLTEWQKDKLSTYEYLLFVNKYSSRTFNDSNQYPIFPWLIQKYILDEEDKNIVDIIYRNFKYPMAAQTEDNQQVALNRFQDDENNGSKFPTHFGTHYSTSSYIYFYLMREEPFTNLLIKLQGYKHENPDRMFYSLVDTLLVLETGCDNRECIPDFFCKVDQFINLNCNDFGCKNNGLRVDDFILSINNNNLLLSKKQVGINNYIKFIIDNKILLDKKIISNKINDWFDIIFGTGQLPDKGRKNCLNVFNEETYEQKTKLHETLSRLVQKYKKQEDAIKEIENKIDLIISFGQTPYQLFNEKHSKRYKKKDDDNDDFETKLNKYVWEKAIKEQTQVQPVFFEINHSLEKLFLFDFNRQLEIIDTNNYYNNSNADIDFKFNKFGLYQLFHIKFFDSIRVKLDENSKYNYYKIKPIYAFSSFNEKNIFDNNLNLNNSENISYYNSYINNLYNENLKLDIKKVKLKNKEEYIRFITCRYMDNSFKIHQILKNKPKKEEKPLSIICEDFVSSCCTLNHNKFFIGLKNGKLIQWSIDNQINDDDYSTKKLNYKIILNKQIQAHKKSLNVIEINCKLGIIITAGEDNYVFVRKLYDFELLTPIKIKSKFIITMVKISPMNFLYIMCFNKKCKRNKSIIFGYTLNGLYFAKSKYGYYDSLDFTKNGNIVTLSNKKEIEILSGDKLKNIIVNKEDKEINEIQNKIFGASWIKYDYFYRQKGNENIVNKIITYSIFDKNKEENLIETIDVRKIKYFD